MHYLIDGHNLIARVPGLSLSDPDDEAKLVQLLRRWAAADARRKVTVIFDKGLPAGEARHLSGGSVRAVFAPDNRSADALLLRRIEGIEDPAQYTVVSSDGAILRAAQRRRVPTQRSEQFATAMVNERTFPGAGRPAADPRDNPTLSPGELDEWLTLFGPEPETKPTRPARKPTTPPPPAPAKKKPKKEDDDDLDEWFRLFGYKKE
jgi:hypothetical protein